MNELINVQISKLSKTWDWLVWYYVKDLISGQNSDTNIVIEKKCQVHGSTGQMKKKKKESKPFVLFKKKAGLFFSFLSNLLEICPPYQLFIVIIRRVDLNANNASVTPHIQIEYL